MEQGTKGRGGQMEDRTETLTTISAFEWVVSPDPDTHNTLHIDHDEIQ